MQLPLVPREVQVLSPERPRAAAAPDPTSLLDVRVLVVDDDEDACELLDIALQGAGAKGRAVRSARAALETWSSFRPDLLLSDIAMPEEDGHSLISRVRAREVIQGGHVPAVALTACGSRADRERALGLGFEAHVAKPARLDELAYTLARLVHPR